MWRIGLGGLGSLALGGERAVGRLDRRGTCLGTGDRGSVRIGLGGDEVDFTYGDVGEVPRADHRADLMLTDSAIAVRLRVIGAEQKPWILRDIAALWQGQGVI